MGGKKKKKAKKKKEKAEGEEGKEDEVNPLFIVNLPQYGWIRVELKLCDPPTPMYNSFKAVMRSNQSVMDIKKRIIDFHGRVDNINLYNCDPYPERNKKNDFKKEAKPRVPPFRDIKRLLGLKRE